MNLNLYDADLNRIAIIGNQYISCLWSEGYNTVENFVVELNDTEYYRKKIKPDFYVGRDDRKTLTVIKTVEISDGKIIASGKQATRILDDVSFLGTINQGSLIDTAVRNAYNNSAKYKNLEFAETNLGIKTDHQVSNKSFLSLCQIMCQEKDVGIRAVRENGNIFAEFYCPEDNTNLVFSEKFGNLFVNSISLSTENLKNYAIVLGEGEGENRTKVIVDWTNGGERKDLIVDAKDIQREEGESENEYTNRLISRGVEQLLERNQTFSCAFLPHSKDFGIRYDLGDVLTVHLTDYGLKIQARVARFTQKSQNNKVETTVEVGQITVKR